MTPTANGLDALNLLVTGWHFLSQLDVDLPGVGLPIVIITGLSIACEEWAISLGASGLVRKPINLESLLAKVQHHVPLPSKAG